MATDLTHEPLANLCSLCHTPVALCLRDGGDLAREDVGNAGCCEDCRARGRPAAHAADPAALDMLRLHLLALREC